MELLWIDYTIIFIYLIGILVLGGILTRHIKSSEDYFLAGRILPFWAIGMSIVVTDIGATDMIGVAGEGYRYGIAVANFDWIGSFPAMILAAFIFIPYYWRSGVYTIPEFLGKRFNTPTQTIHSCIWIAFIILDLGIIFYASSVLLQELLGNQYWQGVVASMTSSEFAAGYNWDYWIPVISTAIIVGIYMSLGGLSAVVLTDVVQLVIMFVGGFAIVGLGLWKVGGWEALMTKVQAFPGHEHHFDLFLAADKKSPYPWPGILFGLGLVMATGYFVANQKIVQRTLGAKSEWHAKASMLFGALFKALIPFLVVTPGLIAIALYGPGKDGDSIMPFLIKNLLPPGMTGLMFVAFLAALMSSIDSMLNSISTLFTKDIYQKFIDPSASDKRLLLVGRIFTIFVLVLGVATSTISTQFEGMYQYVQTLLSFFQGPALAILLLGIFWKKCTPWAGFWGLVLGVFFAAELNLLSSYIFTIQEPFLYVSTWSFVFSLAVTWSFSFFTKPKQESELYGLVYGLTKKNAEVQQALEDRANG